MKIEEVKKLIANKKLVSYKDKQYTVNAVILRMINRNWVYSLELQDLKINSVVIALMEKVENESKDNK